MDDTGTIWFVAAHGAYEWCRKNLTNGTFFRPWNETNSLNLWC